MIVDGVYSGAVIAVPTGVEEVTGPAWKHAFEAGVYSNAVTCPAIPLVAGCSG